MTSFINLLASDVWSEADIKSRLHAEIRSEISEQSEQELNRALQGKALGMHTMTQAETALLMQFKAATDRAALLGSQARVDAALLSAVMALEADPALLAEVPASVAALHLLRNPVVVEAAEAGPAPEVVA